MAGGGGSGIVMLRLNFMTAIYLPILLYAMSTYELEQGTLTISERNLDAVAIPIERSVFSGDQFEAEIFYEPRPPAPSLSSSDDGEKKGGIESLTKPEIILDEAPEGLYYDSESRRFIFNTENVFEGMPQDVTEREFTFSGVARLQSVVEEEYFDKPFEQTFRVRRPTVQVISNAPQRLVQQSRNDLTFLIPGVPSGDVVLRESSTNQTVNGNRITWTPQGDTTNVSVFRRNAAGELVRLDTRGFSVVPPPPPSLNIRKTDGSGPLGPNDIINPFTDELEIYVSPDPQFYDDFPDDSRYEIDGMGVAFAPPGQATLTSPVSVPFDRQRSQQLGEYVYGPFVLNDLDNRISGQINQVTMFVEAVNRINFENQRIEQEGGFATNFPIRTR